MFQNHNLKHAVLLIKTIHLRTKLIPIEGLASLFFIRILLSCHPLL